MNWYHPINNQYKELIKRLLMQTGKIETHCSALAQPSYYH